MAEFNRFIKAHMQISFFFFIAGLFFGLLYACNLLGIVFPGALLDPYAARSIHICLMLYGFIPLMLSYLPFLLIAKEAGISSAGLGNLRLYTLIWYIFLVMMIITLAFGLNRGLAFYDFIYELNFVLAFAGIFYIIALAQFLSTYERYPLWVKVSFALVVIAPFALLFLMNPRYGQVEQTISGPHGDNTLGMSLALIGIYYLIIKYKSQNPFTARWNWMWAVPLGFYLASVLHRSFTGELSYNQEWFLQYLTLLYLPLLYRWYKDADINAGAKRMLLLSLLAFAFVDIEGNILFIPEIRWFIHRNDIIIAHAHIAMAIGVLFMVAALLYRYLPPMKTQVRLYLAAMLGIAAVLSISGIMQGLGMPGNLTDYWLLRAVFGAIAFASALFLIPLPPLAQRLQKYNLLGWLSDGVGGAGLLFFGGWVYPLLGFTYEGGYIYAVFVFVFATGVLHLTALLRQRHAVVLTALTAVIRILAGTVFFTLYMRGALDTIALLIALWDFAFVLVYLLWADKPRTMKEST